MKWMAIAVFFVFLITACSKNIVCTTPYILSGDGCCLDKNNDKACDDEKRVADIEGKRLVDTEDLPELEIEEPKENKVVVPLIPAGKSPLQEGPSIGGKDATVTITVFGDYYDRLSQRFNNEVIPKILERYGDTVLYIYRDVPSGRRDYLMAPAEAAQCALDQGKFWEYHNRLFMSVSKLTGSFLEEHANAAGLDVEKFRECLHLRKSAEQALEIMEAANAYGVTALPTVFVNRQRIGGYRDYLFYKDMLDNLLELELANKVEDRRHVTVDAVGKAYSILRGISVYDPAAEDSMHSNNVEVVDASLYADAEDVKIKGKTDEDKAKLEASLRLRKYRELSDTIYKIKLTSLDTSADRFGGVATDVNVFGNTEIGTAQLPKAKAFIAIFGKADVLDARNRLLAKDQTALFFLTEGLRADGLLSGNVEKADTEAYLILPGRFIGEEFPNQQGFLHLFFESVSYRVV